MYRSCSTCIYRYEPSDNRICLNCEELDDDGFSVLKNYTPEHDPTKEAVMNTVAERYKNSLDGSNGAYYKLPEGAKELADLIDKKNMNFNIGNIFKACYRLDEKEGTDAEYDLKKILFFIKREMLRRGIKHD